MLRDLLWLMEAKQQHDGQRSAGLAGLVSLILVFVAVWKWNEWIYPVLEWSGLVGLAERVGLITDSMHSTMFNVVSMILLLVFSYAILSFVLVMVGLLIPAFLSSKVGMFLITIFLGPFLIIPTLIYGYFWNKKQNVSKKETSSEKFMREYHEKEEAKYLAWLERFENAPQTSEYRTGAREMMGYHRTLTSGVYGEPENSDREVTHFFQFGSYLRNIEPQLDDFRDNVIVFNNETGKFSIVLPNPLPVMVSGLYNKEFENEEVLLDALRLYKEEYPLCDQHIFPSLELEIVNTLDRTYFVPVENASITAIQLVDNDKKYDRFHLKNQLNFYRTIEELNKRSDVQELLDRVNLNTLLLNEIVESHGIDAKPQPDVLGQHWGNIGSTKELFSAQISSALQKLSYSGYNWS